MSEYFSSVLIAVSSLHFQLSGSPVSLMYLQRRAPNDISKTTYPAAGVCERLVKYCKSSLDASQLNL